MAFRLIAANKILLLQFIPRWVLSDGIMCRPGFVTRTLKIISYDWFESWLSSVILLCCPCKLLQEKKKILIVNQLRFIRSYVRKSMKNYASNFKIYYRDIFHIYIIVFHVYIIIFYWYKKHLSGIDKIRFT